MNFRCDANGRNAVCVDSQGFAYLIDLSKEKGSPLKIGLEKVSHVAKTSDERFFVAKSDSLSNVIQISSGNVDIALKVEHTEVFYVSTDSQSKEPIFTAYYDELGTVKVFNLKTAKNIMSTKLGPEKQASVSKIATISSGGETVEFLTARKDCRVDLHEVRNQNQAAVIEWTRYEGLANIEAVEMIDLPLSESQATIETEFTQNDSNLLKTFMLRLTSQVELLKRLFVQFAHRFIKSFEMITNNQASFSTVFRFLLGDEVLKSTKSIRAGSTANKEILPMERDYFNLRKMIIASTKSGSLYGIHNDDGSVVWSLYLGKMGFKFIY